MEWTEDNKNVVENLGQYTMPEGFAEPGSITHSAILRDDEVWIGHRHHNIIHAICEQTGKRPAKGEQGFWTEDGWFLRRVPALHIAADHGQVVLGETCTTRELFSEDLW